MASGVVVSERAASKDGLRRDIKEHSKGQGSVQNLESKATDERVAAEPRMVTRMGGKGSRGGQEMVARCVTSGLIQLCGVRGGRSHQCNASAVAGLVCLRLCPDLRLLCPESSLTLSPALGDVPYPSPYTRGSRLWTLHRLTD